MKLRNRKVMLDGTSPSRKRSPCEVVTSGHHMKNATDGVWKLVMGKYGSKRRQLKELAELSKIVVFGVHRDLDLWCLSRWFLAAGDSVSFSKVVAKGICRLEVQYRSHELREKDFDRVKERCRMQGWHAVRGRTFRMRKEKRSEKLRIESGYTSNIFTHLNVSAGDARASAGSSDVTGAGNKHSLGSKKSKKRRSRKNKKVSVQSNLVIASFNCQGLPTKIPEIHEVLATNWQADIIAVSETWLRRNNKVSMKDFVWYGRNRKSSGVSGKKGHGGLGFFVRNSINQYVHVLDFPNFEGLMFLKLLAQGKRSLYIGCFYAPTCTAKKQKTEEVYTELESLVMDLRSKGDVFLIGDFNARVGNIDKAIGRYNEKVINRNGIRMLEFLHSTGMVALNGRDETHRVAFTRIQAKQKSVIDYAVVPLEYYSNVENFKILSDTDIGGSDHKAIVVTIRGLVKKENRRRVPRYRWKLEDLVEKREEFQSRITEQFPGFKLYLEARVHACTDSNEKVETAWRVSKAFIEGIAGGVIGKKKITVHGKHERWWDSEIKEAIIDRRRKYKVAMESDEIRDWKEFTAAKHSTFALIRKKKQESWEDFNEKMTKSFGKNSKLFWNMVSRVSKKRGKTPIATSGVQDTNGNLVKNLAGIKSCAKTYFEKLGCAASLMSENTFDESHRRIVEKEIETFSTIDTVEGSKLAEPVGLEEINKAMARLKNGKATTDIPNEILRAGGEHMTMVLKTLFDLILKYERIPGDWGRGTIVPIPKPGGDKTNLSDYRGISLLSSVFKLFERVILGRLKQLSEKGIEEEQGGFRKGRDCTDQLFVLQQSLCSRAAVRKVTYAAFVDLSKAFDTVWRAGFLHKLWNFGVQGKIWRVIKAFYQSTESCVLVGNQKTEWFSGDVGVRQGAVTSPLFFSIFVNDLVNEIRQVGGGIQICEKLISILLFADDIVLLADSKEELQDMLTVLSKFTARWRLRVNKKKTKIIVFDPSRKVTDLREKLWYNNEVIEVVNEYKYLGVMLKYDLKWNENIEYVIGKGKERSNSVSSILRFKGLSTEAKLCIWKALVRPILEYGTQIWWPNKTQSMRLERVQLKALKCILGVSSKTSDIVVRLELGVMSLQTRRKIALLKWAGKIGRMADSRLVKYIFDNLEFKWVGKGRANRKTWKKRVQMTLSEFGLVDEYSDAANLSKKKWDKLVDDAALIVELANINKGLSESSKLALYKDLIEFPSLEFKSYLKGVMCDGKRLKFKLRSGTNALGAELKRWSGRDENGVCKCCDSGATEDVKHFVVDCLAYARQRKELISNLLQLFSTGDVKDKNFHIILSVRDNDSLLKLILADEIEHSKEICKKFDRLVTCFLSQIYKIRNLCIFSPLNTCVGSGVNDRKVSAKT